MATIGKRLQGIRPNNRFIIGFFLAVIFSSCNAKKQSFLLPNGDKVGVMTINELEKSYKLKYQQYLGFTSKYNDSFLKEILFLPQNDERIGSDVLNDSQIAELKKEEIKLIKFNYVLKDSSVVSRELFDRYIISKYGHLTQVKKDSNYFKLTNDKGNTICDVKYFDFGMPGYWVTIYPN